MHANNATSGPKWHAGIQDAHIARDGPNFPWLNGRNNRSGLHNLGQDRAVVQRQGPADMFCDLGGVSCILDGTQLGHGIDGADRWVLILIGDACIWILELEKQRNWSLAEAVRKHP